MANQFTAQLRADLAARVSHQRNTPGECYARAADLRSVNSSERTVEVVATTEDPARVWDWESYRVILEVLLMDGAEYEEQTPLLRDHSSYSITSIVGSFLQPKTVEDRLEGLIQIGKGIDDTVEGIWRRVEQGHLRRVSIGYNYGPDDYVTIKAGKTQLVNGRSFTAPDNSDLRVVTRWQLRELSLVVIPADARAQLKHNQPDRRGTDQHPPPHSQSHESPRPSADDSSRTSEVAMKKFLAFLHRCGMAASITDVSQAIAWARSEQLNNEQLIEAERLAKADGIDFTAASATPKRTAPATTGTRSGGTTDPAPTTPPTEPTRTAPPVDVAAITRQAAADALTAERARIQEIRTLGREHEIAAETIETSIDAGHSIDQARAAFLTALRASRTGGAPAIHARHGLTGANGIRVLQAACLLRNGIEPDHPVLNAQSTQTLMPRRDLNIGWACHAGRAGERYDQLCSAYDQVRQQGLQNASLMRLAQELIEVEGERAPYDSNALLERAFSSANFSAIFGATVHLMMWAGYASAPATYERFAEVVDVGDFHDHSEAMVGEVSRLKKQSKTAPGKAPTLNQTDPVLAKFAAERFVGMLKISEQNFIQDSFGALGQTPTKLGQMIAAFIADIVWSELMSTGNLSDGRARFNTTDGNLIASGGTADIDGISAMQKLLRAVKVGDRRIQLGETVVVTGLTLGPKFRILRSKADMAVEDNPHAGTFGLVEDTAVDIGVSDPRTDPETAIAGRPNSYFGLTRDGSIKVCFRTGTNRGPLTRLTTLQQGEWGLCWDVLVDMGAAFLRRLGAVEIRT